MSGNIERVENLNQLVLRQETDFNKLAAIHGAVNFQREASFSLQILQSNSFLMDTALANQDSLKRAVLNVAAIGLSLNPMQKLAYLVPRDKAICLDISYRGYVQLAIDIGAIKWAKAEVVYAEDTFKYLGINKEPVHEFNPFGGRGEIVGAYAIAKTHDGEFLFDFMSNEEIFSIRDRSQSYKSFLKDGKQTPWKTDTLEMIKKTMLKRAAKSWPMTNTKDPARFSEAIDVTNDIDFSAPVQSVTHAPATHREENIEQIKGLLEELERPIEKYIAHAKRFFRREEIKAIEDLTDLEISQAIIQLTQLVDSKKKKEAINENAG